VKAKDFLGQNWHEQINVTKYVRGLRNKYEVNQGQKLMKIIFETVNNRNFE